MRKNLIHSKVLFGIVLCGLSVSLGCKKAEAPKPSTTTVPAGEVYMQNTAFGPASLSVAVNTTVKWTNKDNMEHTVTADDKSYDSGTIANGGTYSHQYTTAGTYPYHCSFHSGMTGTVTVK